MSNAILRYRIINNRLINGRIVTIDELVEACIEELGVPISERTIREDIREMRENRLLGWDAPIENVRPRRYRYSDRDYSIDKLRLTSEEMESLNFMGKLLDQYKKMEPFKQIPGAIQKIFNHINIRKELLEDEYGDFIDFEKAPKTPGLEHLVPLIQHIRKKHVLKIRYHSYAKSDAPAKTFYPFHPYLLKEYRNRWYLLGYNEYFKDMSLYGLDRIKSIERIHGHEYIPSEIPPREYFRNVIGVTKFHGTMPQKVLIKCSKHLLPYILSQPLHGSQETVHITPEYTIISLEVHDSPELQIILHGWNKQVEVLEPPEMRDYFKKTAREVCGIYGG